MGYITRRAGQAFGALACLLILSLPAASAADAPVVLHVEGAVKATLSLTEMDLKQMPQATATLTKDGKTDTYSGVLVYDILVKAGVAFGKAMTGKPMASYLLATGHDGYQVVFAPPEIDPAFEGSKVIVAYARNGGPLPPKEQPVRIIAPQDKMHARSIYSLVKLEVVRLRPDEAKE